MRISLRIAAIALVAAAQIGRVGAATAQPAFNLDQAISDKAQSTTLAFSGFGMLTGNLGAQSFFPPGKVADYWGFQYLRDNDPSDMGHNTSFLTRVSSNVLYILDDAQLAQLKTLAKNQVANINLYGWKRYPLMKSFRRLVDGTAPAGASGLSLAAVKAASRDLYLLDGQISYERAVAYANIYRSLTATQKAYLDAMVGKGFSGWPDKSEKDVASKTQGLPNDEVVAVMTYAGDLYSWYAGTVTSDVYFCPERHGTYFGSFFIKDAPAVNHPGYSIDETMTATVGAALVDSSLGYISATGAAKMNALVSAQRQNLYANSNANIVLARTRISEALRSLIASTAPGADALAQVRATVDTYSAMYGELDGENNYNYATTFAAVFNNVGGTYLTAAQKTALAALRKKYMTVTYADGTTQDFSAVSTSYLYAAPLPSTSAELTSYTADAATDPLFATGSTATTTTSSATTSTTSTTSGVTTTTVAGTTSTTQPGAALNLVTGWNLVGNGTNGSIDVAAAFANADLVKTVWKWQAASAKWAFYAPSLSPQALAAYASGKGYDVLTTIAAGDGFWLNAAASFSSPLPVAQGLIASSSFQAPLQGTGRLISGWNLVSTGDGYSPSQFNRALSSAPPPTGTIPSNVVSLWAWNAGTAQWYFYAPSLEGNGTLPNYATSKGYLDFAASGKALGVGTGFWVNVP